MKDVAFVVVGLPGILIALLVRFTLREPNGDLAEAGRDTSIIAPFLNEEERDVVIQVMKNPSVLEIIFGREPKREVVEEINFTVPGIAS